MCVCWFVGLLFIGHTTFVHFAALPPSGREQDQPSSRAAPRAGGKRMHSESTRAHAVQLLNEKIAALIYDAFQKQSRTRAHAVVYVTAEILKKKTNMPLPKFSLQFVFSWSVYFSNRTESYSSQIEQCVFVGLSAFYRPHEISHFAALPPSGRAQVPSRAALRARASMHIAEHAGACRTTSQRKNRSGDVFQKQNRTGAHAVVYVTAEIFKKGGKENQHATSQVQFTVCLLLECLLFESY